MITMKLIDRLSLIVDPNFKSMATLFLGENRGKDQSFYNSKNISEQFCERYASPELYLCSGATSEGDEYYWVNYNGLDYDLRSIYIYGNYTQLAKYYILNPEEFEVTETSKIVSTELEVDSNPEVFSRTFSVKSPIEVKFNFIPSNLELLDAFGVDYVVADGKLSISVNDEVDYNFLEILFNELDNEFNGLTSLFSTKSFARRIGGMYDYDYGNLDSVTESLSEYLTKLSKNDYKEWKKARKEKREGRINNRYEAITDWFREPKNRVFMLALTPAVVATSPLMLGVLAGAGGLMFGAKRWRERQKRKKQYLEALKKDYYIVIKGQKAKDDEDKVYYSNPIDKDDVDKTLTKMLKEFIDDEEQGIEPTVYVCVGRYMMVDKVKELSNIDLNDSGPIEGHEAKVNEYGRYNQISDGARYKQELLDLLTQDGVMTKTAAKSYEEDSGEILVSFGDKVFELKDKNTNESHDFADPNEFSNKPNWQSGISPWITATLKLNLEPKGMYNPNDEALKALKKKFQDHHAELVKKRGEDRAYIQTIKDIMPELFKYIDSKLV